LPDHNVLLLRVCRQYRLLADIGVSRNDFVLDKNRALINDDAIRLRFHHHDVRRTAKVGRNDQRRIAEKVERYAVYTHARRIDARIDSLEA
jgi:hypothetical protein